MKKSAVASALSALLASSSLVHFLRPQTFDEIVPSQVPGTARQVVCVSGMAELACALLVALPKTRRLGGYASAALFVGVFPGNLKMAADGGVPGGRGFASTKAFAYGRLPLQLPLVLLGLRVGRGA